MKSVETAFAVLQEVADRQPVGVSEITRTLELPKSTVQRALQTLDRLGWIRRDGNGSSKWLLTTRALTLGGQVMRGAELRPAALPTMQALAAETGETIHLTIPEGGEVVLIEKVDSLHPVRTISWIGGRAPIHASSSGKAVLAHLPAGERASFIQGVLPKFNERTILDPDELEEQLAEVRARGYAINVGEWRTDVLAVGSAILDRRGLPLGAISISMPAHRAPEASWERYGALVREAADAISRTAYGA